MSDSYALWQHLHEIRQILETLVDEVHTMSAELDTLKAEVAKNTSVTQSAVTLIQGLAARIEELKTDPVALQALADELKGSSTALGKAVTDNTPNPTP